MKIFIDLEFTELNQKCSILSLGAITEDHQQYYFELDEEILDNLRKLELISKWIEENVIKNFKIKESHKTDDHITFVKGDIYDLRQTFSTWLKDLNMDGHDELVFVSDVGHFDWVFTVDNVWDNALNVPEYIDYIPLDLATLAYIVLGDSDFSRKEYYEKLTNVKVKLHNALEDAIMTMVIWNDLEDKYKKKGLYK
jgi:hypothetical protein